MKLLNLSIVASAFLSGISLAESNQGNQDTFTPLFNGKDFTGWTQVGGKASYTIKDGEIIGTTAANTPNSFLTTDQHYANFELIFEVKLDHDELNSGCQIRSNSSQDYRNGVMHGYQVEIESLTGTAGFIYDENRRGWLSQNRVDKEKNAAYKKGEWNTMRILCQGDSIKTWVNGVAIADLKDSMTSSGTIGLQVHSVPGDPQWSVRWKNIRIKELPDNAKPLSNGKNLNQFTTKGNWKINADGDIEIIPREGEEGWKRYASYLWANQQYADFACSFEYQHPKGGNGGFYFRVADANDPVETGIEIQLLDSYGKKGALSHHDCGGVVFTRPPSKNMALPAGEWNKMTVRCEGNHLKVWLNGAKIQDMYINNTPLKDRPMTGHVGFQDHGLPFKLRNIMIEEL